MSHSRSHKGKTETYTAIGNDDDGYTVHKHGMEDGRTGTVWTGRRWDDANDFAAEHAANDDHEGLGEES